MHRAELHADEEDARAGLEGGAPRDAQTVEGAGAAHEAHERPLDVRAQREPRDELGVRAGEEGPGAGDDHEMGDLCGRDPRALERSLARGGSEPWSLALVHLHATPSPRARGGVERGSCTDEEVGDAETPLLDRRVPEEALREALPRRAGLERGGERRQEIHLARGVSGERAPDAEDSHACGRLGFAERRASLHRRVSLLSRKQATPRSAQRSTRKSPPRSDSTLFHAPPAYSALRVAPRGP